MKSGKKLFRRVLLVSDRPDSMRRLLRRMRKGDLRSLVMHASRTADCTARETILAMAMCEVVRRFMLKGKEIL